MQFNQAQVKLQMLVDCFSTLSMIKSLTSVWFLSISMGYLMKWIEAQLHSTTLKWRWQNIPSPQSECQTKRKRYIWLLIFGLLLYSENSKCWWIKVLTYKFIGPRIWCPFLDWTKSQLWGLLPICWKQTKDCSYCKNDT